MMETLQYMYSVQCDLYLKIRNLTFSLIQKHSEQLVLEFVQSITIIMEKIWFLAMK